MELSKQQIEAGIKAVMINERQHHMENQRSSQQNKSLHAALTEIAADLQQQGIERRNIVDSLEGYSAPITMEFLKEVYKTIIYTMYRVDSTTKLTTKQMVDSWDVFSKFMGENYGISYVWPSQEAKEFESYYNNN